MDFIDNRMSLYRLDPHRDERHEHMGFLMQSGAPGGPLLPRDSPIDPGVSGEKIRRSVGNKKRSHVGATLHLKPNKNNVSIHAFQRQIQYKAGL